MDLSLYPFLKQFNLKLLNPIEQKQMANAKSINCWQIYSSQAEFENLAIKLINTFMLKSET